MTAEMLANNPDETPEEDNSEEIGEEVDDVDGNEEQLVSQDNSQEDDSFWGGNPDELPEELQHTYKGMQSAFTKRMQRVSELERKYFESIDAANAAILTRSQAEAPAPEPTPEEVAPDLARGASPEDVIQFYVKQAVAEAVESSGMSNLAKEMQPVAHREKVVGAYRSYASQNPGLDHGQIAPLAGRVIDGDPELTQLATVNPEAAIKIAARLAQAEIQLATTKQKSKKRRQAAPVSARKGTPIKQKRETMLDAATRALKEAGISPENF